MTKRLLALLLASLMLLPLAACGSILTPDLLEGTRKSTGWTYLYLAEQEDATTLRFPFPMEWKLNKRQSSLAITAGDAVIGEIYKGTPRDAEEMTLHETKEDNGVTVGVSYGKLTREDETAPFYQFHYQ